MNNKQQASRSVTDHKCHFKVNGRKVAIGFAICTIALILVWTLARIINSNTVELKFSGYAIYQNKQVAEFYITNKTTKSLVYEVVSHLEVGTNIFRLLGVGGHRLVAVSDSLTTNSQVLTIKCYFPLKKSLWQRIRDWDFEMVDDSIFPKRPALTLTNAIPLPPHSLREDSTTQDLTERNLGCAKGLFELDYFTESEHLKVVDQFATRVKSETQRHFFRFCNNPPEYENSEGFFCMLMMSVVLTEDFGVRYNPAKTGLPSEVSPNDGFFSDPSDVFIHGLLGPKRMGTCASMPVLYVALGRRLGYPLKLVTTKGHLFVRWEGKRTEPPSPLAPLPLDGLGPAGRLAAPVGYPLPPDGRGAKGEGIGSYERFNIEVTGRGVNRYDDDHYRHWPFELTDQEIAENGYLKSLTPDEEHAVFLTIRAECLKEAKRLDEAVTAYKEAVRLAPHVRAYRLLLADTERFAREQRQQSSLSYGFDGAVTATISRPATPPAKGQTP